MRLIAITLPTQTKSRIHLPPVVTHAMTHGYRHVDSAAIYRNEAATAAGMLASGIPREQLFFTSKIPHHSMTYSKAKRIISKTLANVNPPTQEGGGLGYIDLMLLHAPFGGTQGRLGAWKALVEAVNEGVVRSIGVSNYGVHHLQELWDWMEDEEAAHGKGAGGILSVNQVELHPWLARDDIVNWCREHDVVLEAYSPLVRGTRWGEDVLQRVAKKHGKTEAQVLVRWSLQMGFVPLPKSVTPRRIEENADVFTFELDDEDMESLRMGTYETCTWGEFHGCLGAVFGK